ncbi:low molecular weight protein-tyrosine-phosphatase [Ruania halotolerans]|uniref:low molecular weight protein-tyrosine-phosphatase n=1 Tax=Ruania halotolerans TaxID=2897773 RepID=UPI001E4E0739|nr:low molecular weight protein-tyrosine-phosphatase [Ruania halotolerans]UFU06338.1 low molecular weight phosphotyrosine protein phosphatase [Ruania halotolerans]
MTYRISVVCTGNICRSPMGEAVLRDAFEEAGLGNRVEVISAGTGAWHLGDDADHRTHRVLTAHGHELVGHQATQFTAADFADLDLVLALDSGHARELRHLTADEQARAKIRLIRSFDPTTPDGADVADPYYGEHSDFETVYAQVSAAVDGLVAYVRAELEER